jgi:hypothetical protein
MKLSQTQEYYLRKMVLEGCEIIYDGRFRPTAMLTKQRKNMRLDTFQKLRDLELIVGIKAPSGSSLVYYQPTEKGRKLIVTRKD